MSAFRREPPPPQHTPLLLLMTLPFVPRLPCAPSFRCSCAHMESDGTRVGMQIPFLVSIIFSSSHPLLTLSLRPPSSSLVVVTAPPLFPLTWLPPSPRTRRALSLSLSPLIPSSLFAIKSHLRGARTQVSLFFIPFQCLHNNYYTA